MNAIMLRRGARAAATTIVLCALALFGAAAPLQAQRTPTTASDDVARSLFLAGKSAFATGNYEDALQYFEQSFERSGRPQLQYNIGLAADRLRQDDKALAAFRSYLDQVPSAENREEVEGRIRALEKARVAREAAATSAPTPEETALASQQEPGTDATTSPADQTTESSATKPITQKWWFWTGVGAVVVGAVITAVALSGGGATPRKPIAGDIGGVVQAVVKE